MNFIFERVKTICNVLQELMQTTVEEMDGFIYAPGKYKETSNQPPKDGWQPFQKGGRLSGVDKHFWFRKAFTTPQAPQGKQLYFNLTTGREGGWDAKNPQCIVYLDGKMVQGLDVNHTDLPLEFGKTYEMAIYLYVGMLEGPIDFLPVLKLVDTRIEKLYYDLHVPLDASLCFEDTDDNSIRILKELELALNLLDLRQPGSKEFYKSVQEADDYLQRNFYEGICGDTGAVVNCIGHTHIDVAWQWTLAQTREKAQRSFATVINMMKQYPEYKFMSSQPQLYQYVKRAAPELYDEIKEMVRQGRWEVEGAMWLEADCNLPSGESLIRQIIHGKRFMQQEFGVDSKILWLPDVFGYSAALPQILKKCGVEKFVTSKISWSEFNKMPYDSFLWEGMDGTEIFTYFITAQDLPQKGENDNFTTYVGYIRPSQVLGTWRRFQQKEYNNETLITFGFGDGGGGPTRDMLEQQRRLAYGIPGIPKTKIETAGSFLDKVEKNFNENAEKLRRVPKWVGELYLEMHRGTYTSIAKNKKNNRKSELLLREAEALAATDKFLLGGSYPQQVINDCWETVLLNQFHDIIPGSSIFEVYEECDRQYAQILEAGNRILEEKRRRLTGKIASRSGMLVYNPNSFACDSVVDYGGETVLVQDVPAFGWKVAEPEKPQGQIKVNGNTIENQFFRVVLDQKGNMASIYDKRNDRELIKPGGCANELQVFEDFPRDYDAWEITNYYKQKMWTIDQVEACEPFFEGAAAGLKVTKRFLNSTLVQKIYLYEGVDRIDIKTEADWHERHVLLKAAFPLELHANRAAYEIQFGYLERPTHENTSWDKAKFEVCAHKWADISEDDYGVSLLNDCKYGYNAEGSTIKLTLLKCATFPNPEADQGRHSFVYSVYPHSGALSHKTVQQAYLLNQPMTAWKAEAGDGSLPAEYSLVSCGSPSVIVEAIKKAEDENALILRLYQSMNRKESVELALGFTFEKAELCSMMEETLQPLEKDGDKIRLPLGAFEIATIKLSGIKPLC